MIDTNLKWTFRIAWAVIIGLGIAVVVAFSQPTPQTRKASDTLYHTFKLSDSEVGVNCRNGGQPTVTRLGNLVVVGCVR